MSQCGSDTLAAGVLIGLGLEMEGSIRANDESEVYRNPTGNGSKRIAEEKLPFMAASITTNRKKNPNSNSTKGVSVLIAL